MEKGVKIISAISEVFSYRRQISYADRDEIAKHIMKFASEEEDEETKIGMVVAATRIAELMEKNPTVTEKEAIRIILPEIPKILSELENHN